MQIKLKKFFDSQIFLPVICVFAVLLWYINLFEAGILIILLIGLTSLFFASDIKPLIASAMMSSLAFFRRGINISPAVTALVITAVILFAAVAFFVFFKKNRTKINFGAMAVPILLALVAGLLGGINYPFFEHIMLFKLVFKVAIIYSFYFLIINFTKGESVKYFAQVIVLVALAAIIEVWVFFLKSENFWTTLKAKAVFLGWGNHNIVAQVLALSIPMLAYLAYISTKLRTLYISLMGFYLFNVFVLLSRSNILIGSFLTLVSLVFIIYKSSANERKKIYINMFAVFVILGLLVLAFYSKIENHFTLTDKGRMKLYKEGINNFLKYPIFGVGVYIGKGVDTIARYGTTGAYLYHNTVVNILACAGIVGLILCAPMFYQKYAIIFKSKGVYVFFALLSVLTIEGYGLLDVSFLHFFHNMFLFLLIASVENYDKKTRLIT